MAVKALHIAASEELSSSAIRWPRSIQINWSATQFAYWDC
jgi:hypothetical protein